MCPLTGIFPRDVALAGMKLVADLGGTPLGAELLLNQRGVKLVQRCVEAWSQDAEVATQACAAVQKVVRQADGDASMLLAVVNQGGAQVATEAIGMSSKEPVTAACLTLLEMHQAGVELDPHGTSFIDTLLQRLALLIQEQSEVPSNQSALSRAVPSSAPLEESRTGMGFSSACTAGSGSAPPTAASNLTRSPVQSQYPPPRLEAGKGKSKVYCLCNTDHIFTLQRCFR